MGKVEAANVSPPVILGQIRGSAQILADQLSPTPCATRLRICQVPSIGKNSKQPVPRDSGA